MKKGLGILFMLTFVVTLASVGVFAVNKATAQRIIDNRNAKVQEAVEVVFPDIKGTSWLPVPSERDFKDSPIIGATEIMDGETLMGIVYTVSFNGFANSFNYVVGVNREGEITGYQTLKNSETASSAGEFNDPATFEKLNGALLDAASSTFDGVTGATYTSNYLRASLDQVAAWHASAKIFPALSELDINSAIIKGKLGDDTLVITEKVLTPAQAAELAASPIDYVYEAKGESKEYVAYIEEYPSFQNMPTKILLIVDLDTNETVVFEVLENNDTSDWGGVLKSETDRWTQLEEVDMKFLLEGDFDDLGGATTTYSTWQAAMFRIGAFHQEIYQDIITYSVDALKDAYIDQLSSVDIGLFSTWTLASDEDILVSTSVVNGVTTINYSSPGTDANSITLSQSGYNLVAGTKYRVTISTDTDKEITLTATLGNGLLSYSLNKDKTSKAAFYTPVSDENNATLTINLGSLISEGKGSIGIKSIIVDEQAPDSSWGNPSTVNPSLLLNSIVEVTEQKLENLYISNVYDVYDDLGVKQGTIYYGYTFGEFDAVPTVINFMLGIDSAGNYTGFRIYSTTDEDVATSSLYTTNYKDFLESGYFGHELEGVAITTPVELSEVSGFEFQIENIENAINEIGRYHNEDYNKRDNESINEDALKAAMTDSVTFVEIYNDYAYTSGVVNVYEAYNSENVLLGYVYAGRYTGREGVVSYTIGVKLDGTTDKINIYEDSETWNDAEDFANYDGSEGRIFANSTWLANFEGLNISNFVIGYTPSANPSNGGESNIIDDVAGVSTTTGGNNTYFGLIDSVYTVLKFHEDNVGGAE